MSREFPKITKLDLPIQFLRSAKQIRFFTALCERKFPDSGTKKGHGIIVFCRILKFGLIGEPKELDIRNLNLFLFRTCQMVSILKN